MKVTNVRIFKTNGEGKIKAYVSIEFDNELTISDFKIMDGKNGEFLANPSVKLNKPDKNGKEYKDTAFIVKDFKKYITDEVIRKFREDDEHWVPPQNSMPAYEEDLPF